MRELSITGVRLGIFEDYILHIGNDLKKNNTIEILNMNYNKIAQY